MKDTRISIPVVALIAATRGAMGAGVGFLLSDRIERVRRRTIGFTLLAIGVVSTIPLMLQVMTRRRSSARA